MQLPYLEERLERVLQPWEEKPYSPISWWEMFQFSASLFYTLGYLMESLFQESLSKPTFGDVNFDSRLLKQPLDPDTREKAIYTYKTVASECKNVGMVIGSETAEELVKKIEKFPDYDYDSLISDNGALRKLLEKEMRGKCFLYITPERGRFWPRTDEYILGDTVLKAFPSIWFDGSEAAACIAMARGTAGVFHLMRVLEIALTVLGTKFGVSLEHTNWQNAIEQLESKVARMNQDPTWKALPDCKDQQEYYSQVLSYLRTAKDAWRNFTMHKRAKFTEEEAQLLFENVKRFMQKLAERLSE